MPTPIQITPLFKKFLAVYLILLLITAGVTASVYSLYLSNIAHIISNVSRNAAMINDTFTLKQNVSPLVTGDIYEVEIFNAIGQKIYFHNTSNQFFIFASRTVYIDSKDNPIFRIVIKANLLKVIVLYLVLVLLMSFLYFPFRRFEMKQYENQRNESIASLTRKVAHDIRSPMSTLNLISNQIKDENIKNLQLAVVQQINSIAEDLLHQNRTLQVLQKSNLSLNHDKNYYNLFKQIESEYLAKSMIHQRKIIFDISDKLKKTESRHDKILYPIICNFLNNSIEATSVLNNEIFIQAKLSNKNMIISIRDSGIGIPKEILNKLGKTQASFGKGEFGNGLAIYNAKKDLTLMNAKLEIDSIQGQYTEIKILFSI